MGFSPHIVRLAPLICATEDATSVCKIPRTELDSHANMVVVGRHCTVFDTTGKTCTVNAFSKSAGHMEDVPIVDAVIAYDCPFQSKTFLLLMRNALYIPELEVNLLPPFIVREADIPIDECPKSQAAHPTVDNHSMYLPSQDLRIPIQLRHTFSYFESRKPTNDELSQCDKIFITPDSTNWNPYSLHFSLNEDAMTDCDGEIRQVPIHERHLAD